MKQNKKIKVKARKSLSNKLIKHKKTYVVDTSSIILKFLPKLVKKGLKGKLIIPNAIIAELENLANKGKEEGFLGLEEIAKLHKFKVVNIKFEGPRPSENQIRYAKSGEIDALIIGIARKNKATLITSDLVQAKSAQAYGLDVLFLKPRKKKEKKKKTFLEKLFKK